MKCTASATDWIRSYSLIRVVITIGLARTKRPRAGLPFQPQNAAKHGRPAAGSGDYFPVQTGLRFSAKAVAPSFASADAKMGAVRGRCRSNMSDWRQSLEADMISLAAC